MVRQRSAPVSPGLCGTPWARRRRASRALSDAAQFESMPGCRRPV